MNWLEITVTTPPGGVEAIAGIFEEMGFGGVVIEDPAVVLSYAEASRPEEWAVSPGDYSFDLPRVKGYLPLDEGAEGRFTDLKAALGRLLLDPAPGVSTREVAEEDWANAWKAFYRPVRAGRRLVVKPSWEEFLPEAGDLVIEMDPGMAFGCGTHPTTGLCLQLLEKYVREGTAVYDVGTGSGILAVAAVLLGAGRVTAVDLDPVACRTAAENLERNGVAGRVRVVQGNLLDLARDRAGLVVANIVADVIIKLAPDAARALLPGGIFIASGIIRERAAEVRAALEAAGLTLCEELGEDGWVALAAAKGQ